MTRRPLRPFRLLALAAVTLSCSSAGGRPPRTELPENPVYSVNVRPAERNRVLIPGTRSYEATLSTVSEERAAESPRRDSTVTTPKFLILLRRVAGGGFLLQLQSDPWRSPTVDSTSPPARTPTSSGTTPVPLQLAVDSFGMHAVLLARAGPACSAPGTETFSPLATRLLILPGLLLTNSTNVLKDSLNYRICSGGTPLQASIELEYTRDPARRDLHSGSSPVAVQLRGSVRGDSTRALPMRLHGTLTGRAAVTPDTGTSALATLVTADFVLDLTAESSVKRQDFRQTVRVRMAPLAPDSTKR